MKPEEENKTEEAAPLQSTASVEGDVIGKTAYSQRFVLKLLLKIANLETLQEAITNEDSFEDNLCVLWDMSADKDVVLYLLENNTLKLIHFALPAVSVPRVIEIMIGIVNNMCCHQEAVVEIMKMESFLDYILSLVKLYDTRILEVIFRLIDVCMYRARRADIAIWLNLFDCNDYSEALYFTLKNSTNRDCLVVALESLNTVCMACNDEIDRTNFFLVFAVPTAIESLASAFEEVVIKQKELSDNDFLERLCNITLQTIINLTALPLNKSLELYQDYKEDIANIILITVEHYKNTYLDDKIVTLELTDIGEAILIITRRMQLYEVAYEKFLPAVYELWKCLDQALKSTEDPQERETWTTLEEDKEYLENTNIHYSKIICYCLEKCSEENMNKVLDLVVKDLENILDSTKDNELKDVIAIRTSNYVCRRNDNSDS